MLTGRTYDAADGQAIGLSHYLVEPGQGLAKGIELARHIARMDPFALRQAKRAVNQTLDVQGFYAAIQSVFDIHQTGHGNALTVGGYPILTRLDQMKEHIKAQ